jgi:hypothetical protein
VLFSSRPYEAYAAKRLGKARTLLLLVIWSFLAIWFCVQVRPAFDRHLAHLVLSCFAPAHHSCPSRPPIAPALNQR